MKNFSDKSNIKCDTVVLGGGPGGYTAAFRAADLGQKVLLIERYQSLGGVCLNVGCIPSKSLLHIAKIITESEEIKKFGINFYKPEIDIEKLCNWKKNIITKLSNGLNKLIKARNIILIHGNGIFNSANSIIVETIYKKIIISFKNAIIATGSSVIKIQNFPYDDQRLINSTHALELNKIPKNMLIIGGGIIGLEMSCIYNALGTNITIIESSNQLIPFADKDIIEPFKKHIKKKYQKIYLNTKVKKIEPFQKGLFVTFEINKNNSNYLVKSKFFDIVLMAIGRYPNSKNIGLDKTGILVDKNGFILVNKQQRTNISHIYAIGDVCGTPMLAHKAISEAKIAAETISNSKVKFDSLVIPSIAYTDPEIAWVGLTENYAKINFISYKKSIFPWSFSGRALTLNRKEGLTKLLFDPKTKRILGGAIVGVNAGELLSEITLAIEMGANLEDIALTIHAHPTLSETFMIASELGLNIATDLYVTKNVTKN
ncbi:dihydrolipoyl dehydrogenase [Candidatus Profftella armatura (Diaphorina cf. continua)]|uniref:Dihydrolipoyl dehydrogenase n=1 Tax=Candidatus Profftella armatura (Diaphorina cf. continua) TaxID=2661583 RepID=A0A7R7ACN1_9PROT|nr:dihydrolipoyl dehydrogenase [Candidatus Profftella armatura (Diaphorina cf. continua)]BCG49594.1 dihydrolipoyl dehydrogenase [Candidatus Profftella armatura (Diaphorina cf. continua)]